MKDEKQLSVLKFHVFVRSFRLEGFTSAFQYSAAFVVLIRIYIEKTSMVLNFTQ